MFLRELSQCHGLVNRCLSSNRIDRLDFGYYRMPFKYFLKLQKGVCSQREKGNPSASRFCNVFLPWKIDILSHGHFFKISPSNFLSRNSSSLLPLIEVLDGHNNFSIPLYFFKLFLYCLTYLYYKNQYRYLHQSLEACAIVVHRPLVQLNGPELLFFLIKYT